MLGGKKPEITQFEQVEDSGGRERATQAKQAQEQEAQYFIQFDLLKGPKSKGSFYQSCKSSEHRVGVMDVGIPHYIKTLNGRVEGALKGHCSIYN